MSDNEKELRELGEKVGNRLTVAGFVFFIILIIVSVFLVKEPSQKISAGNEKSYASFVELGDYKELSVTATKAVVSDEDVSANVAAIVDSYGGCYVEDREGIVDEGDEVELLYCSASELTSPFKEIAQEMTTIIGSGELSTEFTEALIGHTIGDEVAVTLGDGSIYIVQIEHIHQKSDITDDFVASLNIDDISTVEELEAQTRAYLEKEAESDFRAVAREELIASCYNNSLFKEMPQELVDPFMDVLMMRLDNALSASILQGEEKTYDDILSDTYARDGISSVDEYLAVYGLQNARIYAMCCKIAESEKISADTKDIYSLAASDWANVRNDYDSLKDFIDKNGIEVYEQAALLDAVKDYLYTINIGE